MLYSMTAKQTTTNKTSSQLSSLDSVSVISPLVSSNESPCNNPVDDISLPIKI